MYPPLTAQFSFGLPNNNVPFFQTALFFLHFTPSVIVTTIFHDFLLCLDISISFLFVQVQTLHYFLWYHTKCEYCQDAYISSVC